MIKRFFKIMVLTILVALVGYFGLCIFVMVRDFNNPPLTTLGIPKEPDAAKYYVHIANTGRLLMTSRYDLKEGKYILYGFWELIDDEWFYHKGEIVLDSLVWGKITIERRVK